MITVHNIHKAYGAKSVLSGVSAQFPAQRVTSLIGPNGAGKTTLLMMIARLLEPTQGDILIGGRFPYSRGALTPEDHRAIDEAIAFLSLEALRGTYIDEISGGQRQMAFLAMTIAQQTNVLLLDEPLNNLDMKHAVQIMRALRRLCDEHGRTVILVIHDINFAANYSDHIVALKGGMVRFCGPVVEAVTETRLQELYGLDFEIVRSERGCVCNYFNPSGELK
ncbi:ferrichrome transport ATP-binding protein FhuC [Cupriavidus basilensis OR16]|uniref:Ferrichrome transport ATP-binding protein FhuC n=1 Tax=Cupriavidus basilensis OR16 TaxID=1127483 RepID=H1RY02_9BURK|nr:ATP-binding cassette domain-containing protein [Cupriavidus basilensis]EHP44883.1 ferrichrome transport ATP-binding protein FhuC [Cupriavidus basilensis OR16]